MYILLLCCRYLRTRYIALASIISVMLGVATMIVVNSVMEGLSREMQGRIHGILSDVTVESHGAEGFGDARGHMNHIQKVAGQYIAGMTATHSIPAMLSFQYRGNWHQRQITFIGIDPTTYGAAGAFSNYLQHPANRKRLEFKLRDGGYDVIDHEGGQHVKPRERMDIAGWPHRRAEARFYNDLQGDAAAVAAEAGVENSASVELAPSEFEESGWVYERTKPATAEEQAEVLFDPATQTHAGLVLGMALACYRLPDGSDFFFLLPGDDVEITVPTGGTPPKVARQLFTIVDFYQSKLSEYDANLVFAPLETVQQMRELYDKHNESGAVTAIQIKLRDEADGPRVRDLLRAEFPARTFAVQTWRDKQGPLLSAVTLETTILNLLLFMIIAVAGFGILAIFYLIVVEKTKDIGILKSLGARNRGVLGIFLAYGLGLGIVGSGVGLILGLTIVANLDRIADCVAWLTGQPIFDPTVYYFQEIPAFVKPFTVAWIVLGAMSIAVLASILPARRAARLHPVEALRNKL
jgi:lipoprotein-releasing system permease protein